MSEVVLASIISGGLALIGVIITILATQKRTNQKVNQEITKVINEIKSSSEKSDAKLDKEVALLRAEVDELMREVRVHNNFAQRMPVVENQIKAINEELKEIKKEVRQ